MSRKRQMTPEKAALFENQLEAVREALQAITGHNDGLGYYLPVGYVDKLLKARHIVDHVSMKVSDYLHYGS